MAARRLSFTRSCSSTAITLTFIESPTEQMSATLPTYSFGQFADVAQAIAARQDLDEGTKVLDARDPAVVDLADLHAGSQGIDSGQALFGGSLIGGSHGDRAVFFDVDRAAHFFLNAANRLATGTNQQADLLGIDLRPQQPRCRFGDVVGRGRGMALSIFRRISMRASRDWASVARMISSLMPSILRSS